MEYVSLYFKFIGLKFRSAAEYRGAFVITFFAKTVAWVTDILMIWLLINQFKNIVGWGQYEVMFLYSLSLASWSIAGFFLNAPFMNLPRRILSGAFDDVLTKPLNPFLYLITRDCSTGYISNITVAAAAIILCVNKLDIGLGNLDYLFLFSSILGGALIQGAVFIIANVPAFWIIQNKSLQELLLHDLRGFIRYPLSAYNKFIQLFLTFALPYAFINYYPAHLFLKKSDQINIPTHLVYFSPVIGILFFGLSYMFWKYGLKHYKSTGS